MLVLYFIIRRENYFLQLCTCWHKAPIILIATTGLTKLKFLDKSMSDLHKNLSTGPAWSNKGIFDVTGNGGGKCMKIFLN